MKKGDLQSVYQKLEKCRVVRDDGFGYDEKALKSVVRLSYEKGYAQGQKEALQESVLNAQEHFAQEKQESVFIAGFGLVLLVGENLKELSGEKLSRVKSYALKPSTGSHCPNGAKISKDDTAK